VFGLACHALEAFLGGTMLVSGLAHLRGDHATRINRESDLQTDGALGLVEQRAPRRVAVVEGVDAVGSQLAAACHQIDRWKMTAAGDADVLARDVGGEAAGDQGQILLKCHVDPAVLAHGVRVGQFERLIGPRQVVEHVAGDLTQRFLHGGQ
jgi:hypothetical protein